MPSEKLRRILLKESRFTPEQIDVMTEREGWRWFYANRPPVKKKHSEVCFTGFTRLERDELALRAEQVNLVVVTSVTKSLSFLCAGENAGPAKLEKARMQNVLIMDRAQFEGLLETGEIPT